METSAAQAHGALRKMSLRDPEGMEHVPGAGELTTYFSGPLHMPQEEEDWHTVNSCLLKGAQHAALQSE